MSLYGDMEPPNIESKCCNHLPAIKFVYLVKPEFQDEFISDAVDEAAMDKMEAEGKITKVFPNVALQSKA